MLYTLFSIKQLKTDKAQAPEEEAPLFSTQRLVPLIKQSAPIDDPKIANLISWITDNGGIVNVVPRESIYTGKLRGLYAKKDMKAFS
jgi:hypothetical protein